MEYVHAFWVGGLIGGTDFDGPDQVDAGKNHGAACMRRRSAWIFEYLRTISEICRSRSERTAPWIRKRTVERCQRSR